ncbi:MAG: hypothetical protein KDA57_17025, partial [Planctomycetales bacterium]|nr:hypothetical protein [Planctomycetales bacterium]
HVNIELKYYGHDKQLVERVADLVDSRDMGSEVVVMSLNSGQVRRMRALKPDWKVGQVMSVSAGNLKRLPADFLAVNASFVNRNLVRRAHKLGMDVYVWTVNDAASISKMISRGVDALLTDEAALALAVVQQRAEMSFPERLLLELADLFGVTPKRGEQ